MNQIRTEAMESARRRNIVLGLVAFGVGQISDIVLQAIPDLPRAARIVLVLSAVAGGFLWILSMWKVMQFIKLMKRDPALAEALNDERYRHAILRSHAAAFWILLLTSGALLLWSLYLPLSGRVAAQLFLVVAVCSAMIALLIYDRE